MKHISEIDTTLTNKIKGQDLTWTCPDCDQTETQFQLRIILSGKTDPYFPKYIPQIKEVCLGCGRYKRFAPQSDILVDRFNKRLETITIKAKEGRDGL